MLKNVLKGNFLLYQLSSLLSGCSLSHTDGNKILHYSVQYLSEIILCSFRGQNRDIWPVQLSLHTCHTQLQMFGYTHTMH